MLTNQNNEQPLTKILLDETIESKLLEGKSINNFITFKSLERINCYSLADLNTPNIIEIYNEEGKIIIGDTYNGKIVVIENGKSRSIEYKDFPFFPFQIKIENGYKKDGKQCYGSALLFYCDDQGIQKHDMRHILDSTKEWNSSSAIWKLDQSVGAMIIDQNKGAVHIFPHYEFLQDVLVFSSQKSKTFNLSTGELLSDNFKINRERFTLPVFGPSDDHCVFIIHEGKTIEKLILQKDGEYSDKDIGYRYLKKDDVSQLYYDNELTGLLFVIGKDCISVLDSNLIEKYNYLIDFVCKQIVIKKETRELFALDANNKILQIYKIN